MSTLKSEYAYTQEQSIDWQKINAIYEPYAKEVSDKRSFIKFLELILLELHNGHNSLSINLNTSHKLVPSGTDLKVKKVDNRIIIADVKPNSGAHLCGLMPGMEIVKLNNKPVDSLFRRFLPKHTSDFNADMIDFAINQMMAGTHHEKREILVLKNGEEMIFYPDTTETKTDVDAITAYHIEDNIGYIKINNSLGENILVPKFDQALHEFMNTDGLILDLRDTPSGGNTLVARGIMGRFVNDEMPYQRHEFEEGVARIKRVWHEYVSPRFPRYHKPVVILVGYWTGSMGEGIAVGMESMRVGTVVGTQMARLLGGIKKKKMTNSGISFQFPSERIYLVNGLPREEYLPTVLTKTSGETYREGLKKLKMEISDVEKN